MTLLEDLEIAADIACEYAALLSGQKKSYRDPVPETPLAARLRAHAARLQAELTNNSVIYANTANREAHERAKYALEVLDRINQPAGPPGKGSR